MRALRTIISILHRGFDKIKQDGRVMVLDQKSAEKLYGRLYLVESEGTYKVAFENAQALHGLAPKCKLINMHELINKPTNDYVTLLPCENGANVNNKG